MPLKFRSTGVAFSSEQTSKDCTAWSGGWTIGYIYYKAPEEDRDEPLTWIWSIHGVPGKPPGMRGHGVSPTLEDAQASLEESWQAWLRWAHLAEREPGLGQIEQHLGSRLFERGRAGYALTPCGTEMVDLAERMFQDIVGFERRVTGQDLRPSGELRITASDVLLRHLLSAVFVAFRRVYPEIILDIVVSNQRLNLTKRDADVAVRAAYQNPEPLAGAKVARIGWAVFGAASLAGEPFDPVRDGRRHDWLAFADALSVACATKWLRDHADETRIVYKINTMAGLGEAAAGGAGLVLLPCYIGATVPGLAQLTPPLPDLESELWLITHPDLRNTARVRAFLDFCADEIARRRQVLEGVAPAG